MTGHSTLAGRSLLEVDDLTITEFESVLALAARVKTDGKVLATALRARSVGLLFEKPSTRTRVSLEVAVASTGGTPVVLSASELQLGRGESVEDTGRVLGRFLDGLVARVHRHGDLVELRESMQRPVVNALSDLAHPLQATADIQTLRERSIGSIAFVGDGNNVASSLMLACAMSGIDFSAATPARYGLDEAVIDRAEAIAATTGATIATFEDPFEAAEGAEAVYTDVWVSMGDEDAKAERLEVLRPYRIDSQLLARAAENAVVLHCLPAHRGEEISPDVIDGPQSVVFDQAENRLHSAKAILALLIGGG